MGDPRAEKSNLHERAAPEPRGRWRAPIAAGLVGALLGGVPAGGVVAGTYTGRPDSISIEARAAQGVRWLLSRVDVAPAQEERVQAILHTAVADLEPLREQHRAQQRAWLAQLLASGGKDVASESLRSAEQRLADRAGVRLLRAVTEVTEILTPAQREQLLQRFHVDFA